MSTGRANLRRPLLFALAAVLSLAMVVYSIVWMYTIRAGPGTSAGIGFHRSDHTNAAHVVEIVPDSPAERAGLRIGDRIIAINGHPLTGIRQLYSAFIIARPGEVVELTYVRARSAEPVSTRLTLSRFYGNSPPPSQLSAALARVINLYPVLFLAVGIPVLFLRIEDANAWLLALLFAAFIAGAPLNEAYVPKILRGSAVAFQVGFSQLQSGLFVFFFLTFPDRSVIDRKLPWLKWLALAIGLCVGLPLAIACLVAGGSLPLHAVLYYSSHSLLSTTQIVEIVVNFGGFVLGLVALIWNAVAVPSRVARRKARVIAWGTFAGVLPILMLTAFVLARPVRHVPFGIFAVAVMALFLMPLSFAYAVVKHQVMEIPMLLRHSARYVLVQRGFVVLVVLFTVGVTAGFASISTRLFASRMMALPVGLSAGVIFGMVLAWGGTRAVREVTQRIDRSFFRSAYDARHILEDLSQQIRTISTREGLSELLREQIESALHPQQLAVYLAVASGQLQLYASDGPRVISPNATIVRDLIRRGQPWELDAPAATTESAGELAELHAVMLVPMLAREGQLAGLIALGMRRSEEPYSREDKRLLTSVAAQAALAMESIQLAEQIAERIEAERRVAQEMEMAKQVQARLFPQRLPLMRTLDYAARCVQARQVGGDYYDFLTLGTERLGLVLADIAGKGMSAALLMANLQANLRSQYAEAATNLKGLLTSVNRLFYDNTAPQDYATMFFADYAGSGGRLRYANCGHNPPVLLRVNGSVERLPATSTVLGLFEDWKAETTEVHVTPGDTLVIYSDGVTDATSDSDEFFGEERLLDTLNAIRSQSAAVILEHTIDTVVRFSSTVQADDITLIVATIAAH